MKMKYNKNVKVLLIINRIINFSNKKTVSLPQNLIFLHLMTLSIRKKYIYIKKEALYLPIFFLESLWNSIISLKKISSIPTKYFFSSQLLWNSIIPLYQDNHKKKIMARWLMKEILHSEDVRDPVVLPRSLFIRRGIRGVHYHGNLLGPLTSVVAADACLFLSARLSGFLGFFRLFWRLFGSSLFLSVFFCFVLSLS